MKAHDGGSMNEQLVQRRLRSEEDTRRTKLDDRLRAIASVAAEHAEAVDREARFPAEAFIAMREQRFLGILVPEDLGGEGISLSEIADICFQLGQVCSSTAMIYAMHQMAVACLVRHGQSERWHEQFLRRLCAEQLLLASSTTEGQRGGDVRSSAAPIERDGSRISLERRATVVSYGAAADAIVTTARRSATAPASDQVLVVFQKDGYSLEPLTPWDSLGMRGTCSCGFVLRASGDAEQILPEPYEKIHGQTAAPVAHLLWASVWAGIAASAVQRTQHFLRQAMRQANGTLPPGAAHFARACAELGTLRGLVTSALSRYELAMRDTAVLAALNFQRDINMFKVEASEMAVSIVMSALRACGLSGYRNDGAYSIARQLRDVLSSPLMISNDRILANMANVSLMSAVPSSLADG
jgi:acyl-CoA dehydrogenase